jgi:uncharacterized membrane protein (Fun14 family)
VNSATRLKSSFPGPGWVGGS